MASPRPTVIEGKMSRKRAGNIIVTTTYDIRGKVCHSDINVSRIMREYNGQNVRITIEPLTPAS